MANLVEGGSLESLVLQLYSASPRLRIGPWSTACYRLAHDGQQRRHRRRRHLHGPRRARAVGAADERQGADDAGEPGRRRHAWPRDPRRRPPRRVGRPRDDHRDERDRRGPRRGRRPDHHARHSPHVCVSSDINAEFREYERSCTTVLNAAVMPLASSYMGELRRRVGGATLHLLHSAGGMMSVDTARARPLALASSGPAAGVAAAAHVARTLGIPRALAFDMGGTTTEVCLISDGVAETSSQRKLGGYPVRLPMAAVESIGAGGGALAPVDAAPPPRVGPPIAGAPPGAARHGLCGVPATVTDANLLLGYLDPERVYGRAIRLDRERARAALDALARRLGLSLLETAAGVTEVANAAMLRALRLVSVQRGYDLRDFTLIAYGGAGPVHAGALAVAAGIARVLVPAHSGAFSALGCLVSPLRYDAVRTYRGRLEAWDAKPAEDRLRELQEQCVAPLTDEGIALERITVQRSADLRYSGQNYEIEIPWRDTPEALRAEFETRHRRLYGYATGESVECVNLRVVARVPDVAVELSELEPAATPAVIGEQRAPFPGLR